MLIAAMRNNKDDYDKNDFIETHSHSYSHNYTTVTNKHQNTGLAPLGGGGVVAILFV